MSIREYYPGAAAEVTVVVQGAARADDLEVATPCTDYTLRELVNHFVGTTGALARVGRRETISSDDPYGSRDDPSQGDWQRQLTSNIEQLAQAWSRSEAWDGTVDMGGHEMPATMIGEMSLAEVVLHGWDLARATGQRLSIPEDVASELRRSIEETAELGRSMGAYGAEVRVGTDATEFDRALGAAGRDPRWSAGAAT